MEYKRQWLLINNRLTGYTVEKVNNLSAEQVKNEFEFWHNKIEEEWETDMW
jgi:hypothetical protein